MTVFIKWLLPGLLWLGPCTCDSRLGTPDYCWLCLHSEYLDKIYGSRTMELDIGFLWVCSSHPGWNRHQGLFYCMLDYLMLFLHPLKDLWDCRIRELISKAAVSIYTQVLYKYKFSFHLCKYLGVRLPTHYVYVFKKLPSCFWNSCCFCFQHWCMRAQLFYSLKSIQLFEAF